MAQVKQSEKAMGIGSRVAAAIAFYTCLPVPPTWALEFQGVARLAPYIGLLIGGLLGAFDLGLQAIAMPVLTRSALIVAAWMAVTGGLHLDGAMDTADGLAVLDPERRLEVMADSRSGAFGVMAAIALLLLKTAALNDLEGERWLALIMAAGWGRWGQLVAIARYPYLKPTGKGAFHKEAIRSLWEAVPSLFLLLGLSGLQIVLNPAHWPVALGMAAGGIAIAWLTGTWFNHKLGGHTGDTYGATVEWTEAGLLCLLAGL
ncbi:adenosylcobinamide-GDP ribazoletransferase [Trichocoleus desertorum AS-A10]|uniref:adenosylcobinamide-GDP ribazoletransferase n=1 Tax=Trichocoleus desertorum TaxID=1481672 RepID=UPI0032996DF1